MIRWRVFLVVVLGFLRGCVRLYSVFLFSGVDGRVQSVRIDVVRLVFCSFSVRWSMHFCRAVVFFGSIVLLLLVVFSGDWIWLGTVCADLGLLS